ncbi:Sec-independent protein translocase subunit TatB [Streptomyces sp. NPDC001020]
MFSDVGPMELLTLAILVVLLFGPDKLPEVIQNVTVFLRKVREMSKSAEEEVRAELGPEFENFEFEDLHPKTFVRKHVLNGDDFGLDEIRSALDPRAELAEVADAVRETADATRAGTHDTARVSLTKTAQPERAAGPAFDPDAT